MTVPRRWISLCTIGVAVAALHVVLLVALGPAWFDLEVSAAPALQYVQVRSVVPAPGATTPSPARATPAVQQRAPGPALPAARIAPRPEAVAAAEASADHQEPVLPVSVAASVSLAEAPASSAATLIEVPVYATHLPPPGQWRYRMQRGLAVGEAELRWAPKGDARYDLQLEGRVAGATLLEWVSQGRIDAAGIAPERFAVRRRGRDRQAANFQREAAKITFSGPTHELPLLLGAQDRLSWMVQLPAIVAAAPERFESGATVVLFVAGARGDGDVWTFVVQGVELVGSTPALKLAREPRRLYDTRVEVWLDPAEHYLPTRAVQTPSGGGVPLELLREQAASLN